MPPFPGRRPQNRYRQMTTTYDTGGGERLNQASSYPTNDYHSHSRNDHPNGDGGARLSRATSRTSARSGRSTSASASLIKKSLHTQDLRPADLLIERFVAWKAIVQQLCAYFEGIADIETNTSKELLKLSSLIQVPFRAGNQFLGEGGLQDVYYALRDRTKTIADQHANLGRTINSSIVEHLQKLITEVRAHIKNIQNDTGKLASSVAHERNMSTRLVGDLANSISLSKNTPLSLPARSDPYIANTLVKHQLERQVIEENLLQKSLVIMQQNSAHFEEGIVRSIKSAWGTFEEWRSRTQGIQDEMWAVIEGMMQNVESDKEWISFAARSDHLLDPSTPLRDPELINYPLKDDPSTQPLHTGFLARRTKTGGTMLGKKDFHESFYVLTPSGYLHEFTSSDTSTPQGQIPSFSLFLPQCTLGPATPYNAGVHGFHIEGSKEYDPYGDVSYGAGLGGGGGAGGGGDGGVSRSGSRSSTNMKGGLKALLSPLGGNKGGNGGGMGATGAMGGGGGNQKGLLGGKKVKSWTFRARSHEEKMEWWNDIRMLCARYLVASEVVRRSGPVERTVRGVGYAEEDLYSSEDELEDRIYDEAEVYVHTPHPPVHGQDQGEGQGEGEGRRYTHEDLGREEMGREGMDREGMDRGMDRGGMDRGGGGEYEGQPLPPPPPSSRGEVYRGERGEAEYEGAPYDHESRQRYKDKDEGGWKSYGDEGVRKSYGDEGMRKSYGDDVGRPHYATGQDQDQDQDQDHGRRQYDTHTHPDAYGEEREEREEREQHQDRGGAPAMGKEGEGEGYPRHTTTHITHAVHGGGVGLGGETQREGVGERGEGDGDGGGGGQGEVEPEPEPEALPGYDTYVGTGGHGFEKRVESGQLGGGTTNVDVDVDTDVDVDQGGRGGGGGGGGQDVNQPEEKQYEYAATKDVGEMKTYPPVGGQDMKRAVYADEKTTANADEEEDMWGRGLPPPVGRFSNLGAPVLD